MNIITVKFLVPNEFETTSENITKAKSIMLEALSHYVSDYDIDDSEKAIIEGLIKQH